MTIPLILLAIAPLGRVHRLPARRRLVPHFLDPVFSLAPSHENTSANATEYGVMAISIGHSSFAGLRHRLSRLYGACRQFDPGAGQPGSGRPTRSSTASGMFDELYDARDRVIRRDTASIFLWQIVDVAHHRRNRERCRDGIGVVTALAAGADRLRRQLCAGDRAWRRGYRRRLLRLREQPVHMIESRPRAFDLTARGGTGGGAGAWIVFRS